MKLTNSFEQCANATRAVSLWDWNRLLCKAKLQSDVRRRNQNCNALSMTQHVWLTKGRQKRHWWTRPHLNSFEAELGLFIPSSNSGMERIEPLFPTSHRGAPHSAQNAARLISHTALYTYQTWWSTQSKFWTPVRINRETHSKVELNSFERLQKHVQHTCTWYLDSERYDAIPCHQNHDKET